MLRTQIWRDALGTWKSALVSMGRGCNKMHLPM